MGVYKKFFDCKIFICYNHTMDQEIKELIEKEERRQEVTLMMIPSENHTSLSVRSAVGSLLQDKYCEGYPYKRYYQGQENFDKIEELCIERAKQIFNVPFCNVQALSGAPANTAVYFALLKPGDKMMGLRLDQGGHISHGLEVNFSGRFFENIFYHVTKEGKIDYDAMEELALKERPDLIIAGITAFPLKLDFERFGNIAEKCGALLMADISHVAGLVLGKQYPDPVPYCHIITTTTHKTLRGPRGALIMVTDKGLKRDSEMPDKINKAVFPGLQGGPHENNIAGIAVALKEAENIKEYAQRVVLNASVLAKELKNNGILLCSNGTETHLILIDLTNFKVLGNTVAEALEEAGIIVNRNAIPYDPNPPFYPSGVRLGTPAITTRGMGTKEMEKIASFIARIIKDVSLNRTEYDEKKKKQRQLIIEKSHEVMKVKEEVKNLCTLFPLKSHETIS